MSGDFNGDGIADLVSSNWNQVSVILGRRDRGLAVATAFPSGNDGALMVGDVNGDGRLDVAVANGYADTVTVLLGQGDGTLAAPLNYVAGLNPYALVAGDFDLDGRLDIAAADWTGGGVAVLLDRGCLP